MRMVFFLCISILISACTPSSDFNFESEKAVVSQVIENSIGWASNKDKTVLYNSLAQDSTFFIFHPDSASTITGFDQFKVLVERVFMNDKFKATGFAIRDLDIHFSRTGTVAWYRAILDDHGEWDGQPSSWVNTRWTGVLEKRDDHWVIVQMHFSFASDAG